MFLVPFTYRAYYSNVFLYLWQTKLKLNGLSSEMCSSFICFISFCRYLLHVINAMQLHS